MALNDLIRDGAALANTLTADLQDVVQFSAWTGTGVYGEPTYATAIPVKAVIEDKEYIWRLANGQEVMQKSQITILQPLDPNGATGRREPIDPRDKFVFPNGFTGPILNIDSVVNPATHRGYMYVVALGRSSD